MFLFTDDEDAWRDAIRHELEQELNRRVREALESPPGERTESSADSRRSRRGAADNQDELLTADEQHADLTRRERDYLRSSRWKVIQAKRRIRRLMSQSQASFSHNVPDETDVSAQFAYGSGSGSGYYSQNGDVRNPDFNFEHCGLGSAFSSLDVGVKSYEHYARVSAKASGNFGSLSAAERHEFFYTFTKNGFREAIRTGRLPDGSEVTDLSDGRFVDKYGIVRDTHGPFWPADFGPLYATPVHNRIITSRDETLRGAENGEWKFRNLKLTHCQLIQWRFPGESLTKVGGGGVWYSTKTPLPIGKFGGKKGSKPCSGRGALPDLDPPLYYNSTMSVRTTLIYNSNNILST